MLWPTWFCVSLLMPRLLDFSFPAFSFICLASLMPRGKLMLPMRSLRLSAYRRASLSLRNGYVLRQRSHPPQPI